MSHLSELGMRFKTVSIPVLHCAWPVTYHVYRPPRLPMPTGLYARNTTCPRSRIDMAGDMPTLRHEVRSAFTTPDTLASPATHADQANVDFGNLRLQPIWATLRIRDVRYEHYCLPFRSRKSVVRSLRRIQPRVSLRYSSATFHALALFSP